MRRSTVLSLSLQLVFPAFSFRANSIRVFLAVSLLFGVLSWTFLELWIKNLHRYETRQLTTPTS
jgi:hypothetical protein